MKNTVVFFISGRSYLIVYLDTHNCIYGLVIYFDAKPGNLVNYFKNKITRKYIDSYC